MSMCTQLVKKLPFLHQASVMFKATFTIDTSRLQDFFIEYLCNRKYLNMTLHVSNSARLLFLYNFPANIVTCVITN